MKVIKKALKLNREDYYKKHLLIINHILPVQLTYKEAEVLAHFLALDGSIAIDPFGTSGRKLVREKMKISAGGLGNYLDQLKTKEFIYEDEHKSLKIVPLLIPENKEQFYQFKLEIDE
jgi:hypothetical protein